MLERAARQPQRRVLRDVDHVCGGHHGRLIDKQQGAGLELRADAARATPARQVAQKRRGVLSPINPGSGKHIARGLTRGESDDLATSGRSRWRSTTTMSRCRDP